MRIAFVQCPAYGIDAPPVGIAYLSSFLRSKGYETKVFDFNIEVYNQTDKKDLWEPWQLNLWFDKEKVTSFPFFSEKLFLKMAKQLIDYKAEIICFSIHTTSVLFSIELAKKIRKLDGTKIIIFGGPSSFKKYSQKCVTTDCDIHRYADALVTGEGEKTLLDLIKQIEKKGKLQGVKGTIVIKDGKIKEFPIRKVITNLDELPIPDYKEFNLGLYRDCQHGKIRILSSRGCPNKCVFCTDTMIWQKYRTRSAENILKEFRLRKQQGFKFIEFNDSTLNGNLNVLSELCNLLLKENLSINWGGSARIEPGMSFAFLRKMRKAGCTFLNYGIESASQRVLKKMNKHITVWGTSKTIIKTRLAGIKVYTNWIVGFPNESRIDFLKTLIFIIAHRPFIGDPNVASCFINPHSIIEKHPEKFNLAYDEQRNWHTNDMKNTLAERTRRFEIFLAISAMLGYNVKIKIKQEK